VGSSAVLNAYKVIPLSYGNRATGSFSLAVSWDPGALSEIKNIIEAEVRFLPLTSHIYISVR